MQGERVSRIRFPGSNGAARAQALKPLPGRSNYLIGSDRSQWRTNVPNYATVRFAEVYPGVDLVYSGSADTLKYEFEIKPGGNAKPIRVQLSDNGRTVDLNRTADLNRARSPSRKAVLSYSTYLGGSWYDTASAIAVDRSGNAYVAGTTSSVDFPVSDNALSKQLVPGRCGQTPFSAGRQCTDAFVAKLNPTGTELLFATYLGGIYDDNVTGLALDQDGNAYITGYNGFGGFPVVNSAQSGSGGAFVAKLSADGSTLLYSMSFGEGALVTARGIAVDASGNAYVTGSASQGLPVVNAVQPVRKDAVVLTSRDAGEAWSAASGGLPSADVRAIAVDPADPATLYAGGEAGVFKSANRGAAWAGINSGLPPEARPVLALAVDPANHLTVYAGTESGLFKSVDGGANWQPANIGLDVSGARYVVAIVIDPTTPATLYAGTRTGVYKSTDGAATWRATALSGPSSNPVNFIQSLAIEPSAPATLYAGTEGGVLKSTDAGASWRVVNAGITGERSIWSVATHPLVSSTVYAGARDGIVYTSRDGGEHWSPGAGLPRVPVLSIAIDPAQASRVYAASSDGVYVSTDSGATWTPTALWQHFFSALALVTDPGGTLFAGMDGQAETTDAFVAKIGLSPDGSGLVTPLYATYLGGNGRDEAAAIAVDAQGRAYVTGTTEAPDFPVANPFQSKKSGAQDAFVAALEPSGSLAWATYLGGSGDEEGAGIAVDSGARVHVAGTTLSADFPVVNPLQRLHGGGFTDAFLATLPSNGSSPLFATYLGGSGGDSAAALAADTAGRVYLGGLTDSNDFPVADAVQPARASSAGASKDAFIAAVDTVRSELLYSTYLGGTEDDVATAIAAGADGSAYVAGYTSSPDFPRRSGLPIEYSNITTAFVAKIVIATPRPARWSHW